MIDTVVLYFEEGTYNVLKSELFGLTIPLQGGGYKRYQVPSSQEKRVGIHKPALTLTHLLMRGGWCTRLRVECSLPNLLFGNNIDELTESDLPRIVDKLNATLADMGVTVTAEELRLAVLSKLHLGKNVLLPDGITCTTALRQFALARANAKVDVLRTDWSNDGDSLRFHTNAWELIFYDKLADAKKSKLSPKRAIDPLAGIHCAPLLGTLPQGRHVLRMELRMNSRKAIRGHLEKIGLTMNSLTLEDIFSEHLVTSLLLEKLTGLNIPPIVADEGWDAVAHFEEQLSAQQRPQVKMALSRTGYAGIVLRTGPKGFRKILEDHKYPDYTWNNLKSVRAFDCARTATVDPLSILRHELEHYLPLRLRSEGGNEIHGIVPL